MVPFSYQTYENAESQCEADALSRVIERLMSSLQGPASTRKALAATRTSKSDVAPQVFRIGSVGIEVIVPGHFTMICVLPKAAPNNSCVQQPLRQTNVSFGVLYTLLLAVTQKRQSVIF